MASYGQECRACRNGKDAIDARRAPVVPGQQARPIPCLRRALSGIGEDWDLIVAVANPDHSPRGRNGAGEKQRDRDPECYPHKSPRLWRAPLEEWLEITASAPVVAFGASDRGMPHLRVLPNTLRFCCGGAPALVPRQPSGPIYQAAALAPHERDTGSSKRGLGCAARSVTALAPRTQRVLRLGVGEAASRLPNHSRHPSWKWHDPKFVSAPHGVYLLQRSEIPPRETRR
jgi:hypothetical protein